MRVVYIPANPPSPVPEGDEEGSPRTSSVEDDNRTSSLPEAVSSYCIPSASIYSTLGTNVSLSKNLLGNKIVGQIQWEIIIIRGEQLFLGCLIPTSAVMLINNHAI